MRYNFWDAALVGMLSMTNLVKGLIDGGASTLVRAVMEPRFETAEPWEPLDVAFNRLLRTESSTLVVLDHERLIGLVTPEHIGDALTLGRALRERRQRLQLVSGEQRTA
jgi:predicted transcriptional regulator